MAATYLDSSAIVKLVVEEPESRALRRHLRRRHPLVTSALARTEVLRALVLEGAEGLARGRAVLARLELIRVSDRVLSAAGGMLPPELRSLDAIHLASALLWKDAAGVEPVMATHDAALALAAQAHGFPVIGVKGP